jgi:hypothetical protein
MDYARMLAMGMMLMDMDRRRNAGIYALMDLVRLAERAQARRQAEIDNPPEFSHAPAYLPRRPSPAELQIYAAAEAKRARRAAKRNRT